MQRFNQFQSSKVTVSGGRVLSKSQPQAPKAEKLTSNVNLEIPPPLYDYPMECLDFDFALYNESDNYVRTIKQKRTVFYPNATELRRNPYYYTIYCVALNTCFATLIPLTALIYLNCMTLRALKNLLSQQTITISNQSRHLDTIMEENSRCSSQTQPPKTPSSLDKPPERLIRMTPPRNTTTNTSERFARGTRFICGFDNQSSSFGGASGLNRNVLDVRYSTYEGLII